MGACTYARTARSSMPAVDRNWLRSRPSRPGAMRGLDRFLRLTMNTDPMMSRLQLARDLIACSVRVMPLQTRAS